MPPIKPSPLRRLLAQRPVRPEQQRARDLIASIDAGGIPLYPGKVNQIARELGLEVSPDAPVEATIARLRVLLQA